MIIEAFEWAYKGYLHRFARETRRRWNFVGRGAPLLETFGQMDRQVEECVCGDSPSLRPLSPQMTATELVALFVGHHVRRIGQCSENISRLKVGMGAHQFVTRHPFRHFSQDMLHGDLGTSYDRLSQPHIGSEVDSASVIVQESLRSALYGRSGQRAMKRGGRPRGAEWTKDVYIANFQRSAEIRHPRNVVASERRYATLCGNCSVIKNG